MAGQRLPQARTPPGHRPRALLPGQGRISERLPAHPSRSVFPSRFPGSVTSLLPHSRRAAPGGLRSAHNPCWLRSSRTPWPPSSCARSPTFPSCPGGRRIAPDLIPLAVPGLVSGLAAFSLGCSAGWNSGLSTTPVAYGAAEPPGRRPPAPGPQLYRIPQAVRWITPDLIPLAVPGARLSLAVLVTRPRRRLDSGRPRTPAGCGPAEPPGRP
jgi:hypothetical protein